MSLEKWHSAWWLVTPDSGNPCTEYSIYFLQCIHTVIYSIYLQYSAMMDSEALRVRLFVAQSRLRHSQGSDWYISLDIFVLENTKNQAYALRIPALRCTRLIIALRIICLSVKSSSSGNSRMTVSDFLWKKKEGWGDLGRYVHVLGQLWHLCVSL